MTEVVGIFEWFAILVISLIFAGTMKLSGPGRAVVRTLLTTVFFLLSALPVFAAPQAFTQEYHHEAGVMDSEGSSRAIALEQVKRLLLEELGACLERETAVKDYQMGAEQVASLAAGIVRMTIVEEKWENRTYRVRAKMAADPDDVAAAIDGLRKNRRVVEELAQSRQETAEALEEIDFLRGETADDAADPVERKHFDHAIRQLLAADWIERGYAGALAGQHQEAARAFEQAILLKPEDAKAHGNRGISHLLMGNYPQAVQDLDRAVALNPKNAEYADYRKIAGKLQHGAGSLTLAEKALLETPANLRRQHTETGGDGRKLSLKNGDRPAGEKRIAERPRKKRQQEPLKDRKKAEKKKKKAGVHASARTTNGG